MARGEQDHSGAPPEAPEIARLLGGHAGLLVLDRDGVVVAANENAAEILGMPADALRGSSLVDSVVKAFFEDGSPLGDESGFAKRILAAPAELVDVPIRIERRDGSERWVNATHLALAGERDAEPRVSVWALVDMTLSRGFARELAETDRRLRDLVENVEAVFWIRDARTDEVIYVGPAYEEIWGRPIKGVFEDPRAWLDAIHPDDRARVVQAALGSDAPDEYEAEFRIVRPDGSVRWIHDRAFSVRHFAGPAEVVTGMAEDVTGRRTTEAALAEARERARAAFINAPIGSALFSIVDSAPGRLLEVNPAFCAMLGYAEADLIGMGPQDVVLEGEGRRTADWRPLAQAEVQSYDVERRLRRSDGSAIWARLRISLVRGADGEPAYGVVQAEDISSLRSAEARQAAVAALSQLALEGATVEQLMHAAVDAVNETIGAIMTGVLEHDRTSDELVPRAFGDVPAEVADDAARPAEGSDHLRAALDERRPVIVEDWGSEERFDVSVFVRRLLAASTIAVPIQGPDGAWGVLGSHCRERRAFTPDEVGFVQALANVLGAGIQRRLAEEEALHLSLHDPLTELPNRTLFLDRLGLALERTRRTSTRVAVLFMDLDHFKVINDSLGHETGDRLLCAFAPRLKEALRPSDTVARFGGDEFVVLCEELPGEQDAVHLAERILAGLREPFAVASHELFTSATIGVALARPGDSAEGLIRDADAAMYRAKSRGRGRYELFDEAMRERVSQRLRTENSLRRALAAGALSLEYQPVVALEDRSIVGVEALMRWHDAELGNVDPARFIPIAEESGLIVPIGEWALEEACRQALEWPATRAGGPQPHLAVNLSARQVAHPAFQRQLADVLDRTGLPPGRLSLEITESVLIEEAETPAAAVRDLKRLGVRLVLDDFGTGYSSLSYLNRLPIDVLKLDRSFTAPLRDPDHAAAAIISGVVTMAEALGMTVIAEGVEVTAQLEKLQALGCDYAQGFLFARPMPAASLHALLREGTLSTPSASAS